MPVTSTGHWAYALLNEVWLCSFGMMGRLLHNGDSKTTAGD